MNPTRATPAKTIAPRLRIPCLALLLALLLPGTPAFATGTDMRDAARRYVAAMVANDPAGQAALLADDARFEDPMGVTEGKPAILEAWKRQNVRFQAFRRSVEYPSGKDTYVFVGIVDFEQSFKTTDGRTLPLRFSLDCSIALTLRDGTVIRHVDFVDTAGFMAQLQTQLADLRAKPPATAADAQ